MAKLTIAVTTYKRPLELRVLLSCLLCQTNQDFDILLMHDGFDEETEQIVAEFEAIRPGFIDYSYSEERFNDWGHSLREILIQRATGDFLLLTNDDNYYVPRFVDDMLSAIDNGGYDVVFCDMIHNYEASYIGNGFGYQPLYTNPIRGQIDMGSFIVRTKLAKKVGFRDKDVEGDATYFEDVMRLFPTPKLGKVHKFLFMHN